MGEHSIFCCHYRIRHWRQAHRSERDRRTKGKTISPRMLWGYPGEPLKLRDTECCPQHPSEGMTDGVLKKGHEGRNELRVSTGQLIAGKCAVEKGTWLRCALAPLRPAACAKAATQVQFGFLLVDMGKRPFLKMNTAFQALRAGWNSSWISS